MFEVFLTIFFTLVAAFIAIYETAQIIIMKKKLDKPIRNFLKDWKPKRRLISDSEIDKLVFCYQSIDLDVLKNTELYIKSLRNNIDIVKYVNDIFLKLLFPLLTFIIGVVISISSNGEELKEVLTSQFIVLMALKKVLFVFLVFIILNIYHYGLKSIEDIILHKRLVIIENIK